MREYSFKMSKYPFLKDIPKNSDICVLVLSEHRLNCFTSSKYGVLGAPHVVDKYYMVDRPCTPLHMLTHAIRKISDKFHVVLGDRQLEVSCVKNFRRACIFGSPNEIKIHEERFGDRYIYLSGVE